MFLSCVCGVVLLCVVGVCVRDLVLVLGVHLPGADVLEEQGKGLQGGVSGGQVEGGHTFQVLLQPVCTPRQQQLQEAHVALHTPRTRAHTHRHTHTKLGIRKCLVQ